MAEVDDLGEEVTMTPELAALVLETQNETGELLNELITEFAEEHDYHIDEVISVVVQGVLTGVLYQVASNIENAKPSPQDRIKRREGFIDVIHKVADEYWQALTARIDADAGRSVN